jgi:hypothetical protein
MRAATADPVSDSQLEQVGKLALGKRVPTAGANSKVAAAHAALAATAAEILPRHRHRLWSLPTIIWPSGGWNLGTRVRVALQAPPGQEDHHP